MSSLAPVGQQKPVIKQGGQSKAIENEPDQPSLRAARLGFSPVLTIGPGQTTAGFRRLRTPASQAGSVGLED